MCGDEDLKYIEELIRDSKRSRTLDWIYPEQGLIEHKAYIPIEYDSQVIEYKSSPHSSEVEQLAVNQLVVGSNPSADDGPLDRKKKTQAYHASLDLPEDYNLYDERYEICEPAMRRRNIGR